ncbi:PAS domain-containing protein, partial [Bacillus cereus]|nr:PAS domain-containing protein [Bacillus cereus]
MEFSFPTIQEFLESVLINHTCSLDRIKKINERFYYLPSTTEEYNCAIIYVDDSFTALIDAFSYELAVIILNENDEPICCITSQQMIPFLYKSYNELQSFYDTVIQTTDSSVTVIDSKECVRTWTDGAEKIFSVNHNEIIGQPITRFFDYKDLEILQSLHDGKSIVAQFHQPRPDLFVLINSKTVNCNYEIIVAVFSKKDFTNKV